MNALWKSAGPRSLSGVPLEGDRLLRLVYMDEAGISHPAQEPFVVVSAVIINADTTLIPVEQYLDELVEKHIPPAHQENFVFRASDIFGGRGKVFDRKKMDWPLERRLRIADDLAAIPQKFALDLAFGWTERAKDPIAAKFSTEPSRHTLTVLAQVGAFFDCAVAVEHFMRRDASSEVCLLILEDNENARHWIRELHNQLRSPPDDLKDDLRKALLPIRKIKEDPLFQKKRRSSALQVADFCAYVFKKTLMQDANYIRFLKPMRDQFISGGALIP